MNPELKLLFYLKRSEVKQDGTCPIMGRISIGRTMAQFGTKLTVSVSLWDTRANRVSGKSKQAVDINRALDKISLSINKQYARLVGLKGNIVSATEVKNTFQGIASTQETLVRYFIRHNQEFRKRVGVNRELCTAEQYDISLKHLTNFLDKKYRISDIPFSKLDFSFIESFDFYLRVELQRMPNTILGK